MKPTHARKASSTLVPVVLIITAMVSIQSGAAIAKRLFPFVGSTGATTLRLLFAALILGAILRPWRVRMTAAAWRSVIVYGVALGGLNGLFYAALRTVPLGIATALEFTGPLFVAMLASRRLLDFVWIGLATGGLLLLLPLGAAHTSIDPVGAAFALGAGVCWAMYIVFGQKAGAEHGLQATALGVAIAAVCVFPFGVAEAGAALLSPEIIPLAIAVAVLSTAFPYSLEMIGLSRLPKKTFGTLMSIEPAIAALSGLMLLGERLAPVQWIAIGTIIAASAGTTATAVQASESEPQSDPRGAGMQREPGEPVASAP